MARPAHPLWKELKIEREMRERGVFVDALNDGPFPLEDPVFWQAMRDRSPAMKICTCAPGICTCSRRY